MFNSSPSREHDAEARRERLLKAAATVFAKDGFEKASLRAICLKAKANVAAVKYYFGSKEGLYREVFLSSCRGSMEKDPPVTLAQGDAPEETLRRWIHHLLDHVLLKRAANPVKSQIMAHEMREPTPCMNEFIKLIVRPFHEELERIIAAVLGRRTVDEDCIRYCHHIIGLCIHYDHCRVFIDRLGPPVPKTEAEVKHLAENIADFVLGALAARRASQPKAVSRSKKSS
ncbi:CerR family C-terminal domain-containing protein [Prosthecobacter sp.]|uniref:CerR family C-terminal domain-containing protein n=1 Tax=Prosthecobacter sp. TaxID=1965333 RepID=UPI003784DAAD